MCELAEVEQIASVIGTLREKMKEIEGKIQVATDNRKLADEKSQAKSEELNEWLREYNSQEGITVLGVEDIAAFHLSTEKWEDIRDPPSFPSPSDDRFSEDFHIPLFPFQT